MAVIGGFATGVTRTLSDLVGLLQLSSARKTPQRYLLSELKLVLSVIRLSEFDL